MEHYIKIEPKFYMKTEPKISGRKEKRCSHPRLIQDPVKHLRWKQAFSWK